MQKIPKSQVSPSKLKPRQQPRKAAAAVTDIFETQNRSPAHALPANGNKNLISPVSNAKKLVSLVGISPAAANRTIYQHSLSMKQQTSPIKESNEASLQRHMEERLRQYQSSQTHLKLLKMAESTSLDNAEKQPSGVKPRQPAVKASFVKSPAKGGSRVTSPKTNALTNSKRKMQGTNQGGQCMKTGKRRRKNQQYDTLYATELDQQKGEADGGARVLQQTELSSPSQADYLLDNASISVADLAINDGCDILMIETLNRYEQAFKNELMQGSNLIDEAGLQANRLSTSGVFRDDLYQNPAYSREQQQLESQSRLERRFEKKTTDVGVVIMLQGRDSAAGVEKMLPPHLNPSQLHPDGQGIITGSRVLEAGSECEQDSWDGSQVEKSQKIAGQERKLQDRQNERHERDDGHADGSAAGAASGAVSEPQHGVKRKGYDPKGAHGKQADQVVASVDYQHRHMLSNMAQPDSREQSMKNIYESAMCTNTTFSSNYVEGSDNLVAVYQQQSSSLNQDLQLQMSSNEKNKTITAAATGHASKAQNTNTRSSKQKKKRPRMPLSPTDNLDKKTPLHMQLHQQQKLQQSAEPVTTTFDLVKTVTSSANTDSKKRISVMQKHKNPLAANTRIAHVEQRLAKSTESIDSDSNRREIQQVFRSIQAKQYDFTEVINSAAGAGGAAGQQQFDMVNMLSHAGSHSGLHLDAQSPKHTFQHQHQQHVLPRHHMLASTASKFTSSRDLLQKRGKIPSLNVKIKLNKQHPMQPLNDTSVQARAPDASIAIRKHFSVENHLYEHGAAKTGHQQVIQENPEQCITTTVSPFGPSLKKSRQRKVQIRSERASFSQQNNLTEGGSTSFDEVNRLNLSQELGCATKTASTEEDQSVGNYNNNMDNGGVHEAPLKDQNNLVKVQDDADEDVHQFVELGARASELLKDEIWALETHTNKFFGASKMTTFGGGAANSRTAEHTNGGNSSKLSQTIKNLHVVGEAVDSQLVNPLTGALDKERFSSRLDDAQPQYGSVQWQQNQINEVNRRERSMKFVQYIKAQMIHEYGVDLDGKAKNGNPKKFKMPVKKNQLRYHQVDREKDKFFEQTAMNFKATKNLTHKLDAASKTRHGSLGQKSIDLVSSPKVTSPIIKNSRAKNLASTISQSKIGTLLESHKHLKQTSSFITSSNLLAASSSQDLFKSHAELQRQISQGNMSSNDPDNRKYIHHPQLVSPRSPAEAAAATTTRMPKVNKHGSTLEVSSGSFFGATSGSMTQNTRQFIRTTNQNNNNINNAFDCNAAARQLNRDRDADQKAAIKQTKANALLKIAPKLINQNNQSLEQRFEITSPTQLKSNLNGQDSQEQPASPESQGLHLPSVSLKESVCGKSQPLSRENHRYRLQVAAHREQQAAPNSLAIVKKQHETARLNELDEANKIAQLSTFAISPKGINGLRQQQYPGGGSGAQPAHIAGLMRNSQLSKQHSLLEKALALKSSKKSRDGLSNVAVLTTTSLPTSSFVKSPPAAANERSKQTGLRQSLMKSFVSMNQTVRHQQQTMTMTAGKLTQNP